VRDGEVSPRELAEQAIARIEATNPTLNFLVTEAFDFTEPADGPFRGVPMLVKDLTETSGIRTTFSSRAFADYVPERDTATVRRMREAGFTILGKSNTPEFGITCVTESDLNGACRNPWDTSRTPGGSSGGAAAAVAAGALPLAHGSDGGGSIRIPASCCGVFGLKPSRGRVSPAPYVSGSLEMSQQAGLSVSVRDAAALLDVLAGYEPGDAHWAPPPERPFVEEVGRDPGRLRIAFTAEPPMPYDVDPKVAAVWQLTPALYPVADPALLMPINRAQHERAHETSSVDYARAGSALMLHARRVLAFWADVDVVLTPTLAKLPVPIGWIFEPDDPWEQFERGGWMTPFTPLVNVTGQPAASVPFGVVDGLPVGVQLIGPPAGEAMLFRLAAQVEEARPWAGLLPGAGLQ
jgi:amidase